MIQQCEGTLRGATNILTIADTAAENAQNAAEKAQEAANAAAGKVAEAETQAANAANSAEYASEIEQEVRNCAATALTDMSRLKEGADAAADDAEAAEIRAFANAERAEAAAEDRAGVIALDAAGATVTLPDSAERPLRALTVDITATQSADGTINGWSGAKVTACGKNLLDGSLRTAPSSNNGLTVQYNPEDDTYTLNGSLTNNAAVHHIDHVLAVGAGEKITISVQYVSGSAEYQQGSKAVFFVGSSNDAKKYSNFATCDLLQVDTAATAVLPARYAFHTWFWSSAGATFDNYKVRIQVEIGDTATEYEPFRGATASVDFGREVYGGRYDWRTGVLTLTHKKINFSTLTPYLVNMKANAGKSWVSVFSTNGSFGVGRKQNTKVLSNVAPTKEWELVYGEFDTPIMWYAAGSYGYAFPKALLGLSDTSTDEEVSAAAKAYLTEVGAYEVIEVATPEVVQLEPSALPSTLYPSTTVFADTGDVTLTYAADTKNYIDRRIRELIGAK
jgi:hypothetical protein